MIPLSSKSQIMILGTGVAVPQKRITAEELDQQLGLPSGESLRVTGIRQRFIAEDETAAELAAAASEQALQAAGLSWKDVDLLVCASGTMDQALPYNAALVNAELGITDHRLATLDIGASCLSFLQALDVVSCVLSTERYRRAVIVSADIASCATDFRNLRENGIFGDGAAAAVISPSPPKESSCILAAHSTTFPEGVDYCQIPGGGSRFYRPGGNPHARILFEMKGKQLFALVRKTLPGFVEVLLRKAGIEVAELACFIPHQASQQALDHVARLLGFDDGRMIDVFTDYGNQVGASLPTALHFAVTQGRLKRGDKALLLGTGAGVSIGGIVLVY